MPQKQIEADKIIVNYSFAERRNRKNNTHPHTHARTHTNILTKKEKINKKKKEKNKKALSLMPTSQRNKWCFVMPARLLLTFEC